MMDSNPHDHGLFILERLGQKRFDALYERKNISVKRRDVLTPHFYNELQLMLKEVQTPDYGPPYSMANPTGN